MWGVLIFAGATCHYDCINVLKDILNQKVEALWYEDKKKLNYKCIIIPGGFTWGDYLRAGAIAANMPIIEKLKEYIEGGGIILGICNGFQILLEAGLLEGAMRINKNQRFICKYTYLKVENKDTPFSCKINKQIIKLPIAHIQGNYFIHEDKLKEMIKNKQILLRYCDKEGIVNESSNPNGSVYNIAAILSKNNRVCGMMPHPERACSKLLGCEDGILIFKSIISSI